MLNVIWDFLRDETNRAVLGWIGAGVSAVTVGIWAIVTFFAKRKESAPSVSADQGSVAVGRDVLGPVTINPDPKNVVAPIQEQLDKLYEAERPEKSFLLRYLWLDATTSSFLIAGRFDSGLARLLPANPIVIQNPVFDELKKVVDRFGQLEGLRFDPNLSGVSYTLQTEKDFVYIDGAWRDPSDARNRLRIYAAEEDIVW